MRNRRAFLSLLGTGALVGCTGLDAPVGERGETTTRTDGAVTTNLTGEATDTTARTTERTTTPSPTERTHEFGERVEFGGASLELHDPFVQHSAVTVQADTAGVYGFGGRDGQAAFVRVRASGDAPPGEAFSLVADGRHAALREKMPLYPLYYLPEAYGSEGDGWVAFETPAPFDPEADPRVEVETDAGSLSWALPDEFVAALGREPPDFTLQAFETPASVAAGEPVTATVEVENTGGPGTFRGAVNTGGYLHAAYEFSFDVPLGERRREEVFAQSFPAGSTLSLSLVGYGVESVSRRELTVKEG